MDQKKAGARKRKRKPKEENAGAGKRSRRRGAVTGAATGEPQQQQANAAAPVAAVVQKVAECMQSEEEEEYTAFTEESMAQMMSWLALELAAGPPVPVPAAGYVTVQGDEESCGPSFSGSASTVMATVDFRFVAPVPPVAEWPLPEAVPGPREQEEETVDDDWVATLLTDGPAGEGQY
ncbi:uncharacterized protein [Lolium perenne]|jgi:hypothetical protein|uniref:uncharacterized protein n=1 Tax=Lolium perenne TaxID=4522 RepID=UPI0021EAFCAD